MSAEESKRVIREWIDAANRGDEQKILSLLADDFVFQGMARQPLWMRYRWGKKDFAAAPRTMSELMKSPIQMKLVSMIAEGDQVAVEATSDCDMKNGKKYDNAYHFAITVRDGLIREVREYCCSYLVDSVFGEYNRDNQDASRAAG